MPEPQVLAAPNGDAPMVKGLTFVTARRYVTQTFGEEVFSELLMDLPPATRALLVKAEINDWYSESHMRVFIHRVHRVLAEGDDERFMQIARELAVAGISRFFRLVINFASARFVLRKVPVVWARLRRGPATLSTVVRDNGAVQVRYENFIYCGDPVYRLLSLSNCQALVLAACDRVPPGRVVTWSPDSMVLEFEPDAGAQ